MRETKFKASGLVCSKAYIGLLDPSKTARGFFLSEREKTS